MTRQQKIALFISLGLIQLSGYGTDLYAPSLPSMVQALHSTPELIRMSLSIFVLGFAIGQLPLGTLSDHYGRRTILIPCLFIFSASSLLIMLVHSISILLLLRCIQGFVCAGPSAICKAILNDNFCGKAHTRAFSYMALCWGLSIVGAPFVGGYVQHYFDWRTAFFCLAAIGGVLLVSVVCFLRDPSREAAEQSISIRTMAKNCICIIRNPIFSSCAVMNCVFYLFILNFSLLGPFLIQNVWHHTAITYGYMALLIGAAWICGTLLSRKLSTHYNPGKLLAFALISISLILVANLVIAWTLPNTLYTLMLPLWLVVLLCGVAFPSMMAQAMSTFKRSLGGTASSVLGVTTFLLSAITSFFVSHIHAFTQRPWAVLMLILIVVNGVSACIYYTSKRHIAS